jgi:hypothetical protein
MGIRLPRDERVDTAASADVIKQQIKAGTEYRQQRDIVGLTGEQDIEHNARPLHPGGHPKDGSDRLVVALLPGEDPDRIAVRDGNVLDGASQSWVAPTHNVE